MSKHEEENIERDDTLEKLNKELERIHAAKNSLEIFEIGVSDSKEESEDKVAAKLKEYSPDNYNTIAAHKSIATEILKLLNPARTKIKKELETEKENQRIGEGQQIPDDDAILDDISKELYEKRLAIIRQNGLDLRRIPTNERTKELCMVAVRNNIRALQFVPEELLDKELYLHALKHDILDDIHWIRYFWDILGFRKILEVARQVNPNVSEDDYPEDKHLLGVWEQKAS